MNLPEFTLTGIRAGLLIGSVATWAGGLLSPASGAIARDGSRGGSRVLRDCLRDCLLSLFEVRVFEVSMVCAGYLRLRVLLSVYGLLGLYGFLGLQFWHVPQFAVFLGASPLCFTFPVPRS